MARFFIFGFILLITLAGCVPKQPPLKRCRGLDPDSPAISKIVIEYGRDLQDSHRLFLYDSRVIFDGKIKKIRIDFTSMASVELCEARKVLVDVTEGYMKRFRENAILNSRFLNRPLNVNDFEIHITYCSYFNRYVDAQYVAYVILENGWSYFYNSELNNAFTDFWMQKVEPYYETKLFTGFQEEAEALHKKEDLEEGKKILQEERYFEKRDAIIS